MQKIYLKKIFDFAVIQGLIETTPLVKVIYPKKRVDDFQKKKVNFLEKNELLDLLNILKEKEEFMTYTGLRKSELYALVWTDIDFKDKTLTVNKTASYLVGERFISSPKTQESNRTISIDDTTRAILIKWKLEQKKMLLSRGIRIDQDTFQKIFSQNGNDLLQKDYINKVLHKYPKYKITAHGLRHTHASLSFESGASIKKVQKRLGHKNIQTTMNIYTHVTKDAEKDTAISFEKYLNSQYSIQDGIQI